jgi:hypothetical protein
LYRERHAGFLNLDVAIAASAGPLTTAFGAEYRFEYGAGCTGASAWIAVLFRSFNWFNCRLYFWGITLYDPNAPQWAGEDYPMTDDERRLESLKFLRESGVWMVGVQTLILGFLVTLLGADQLALGSPLIKGAAAAFGISIVCAGIVLGLIPWVVARQSPMSLVKIGWMSGVQYVAFVVGIVLLAAAILLKQVG